MRIITFMPDFSTEAVHQFWANYDDPMIYKVILFMETVEQWAQDGHPEVEVALRKLGEELENINDIDLEHEDEFINVCTNLKMGRTLRLMQCLDTARPGAASKLLIHAEENSESSEDMAGIFLRRNIVFERLRLLSRVFSQQRLELVTRAIEGD